MRMDSSQEKELLDGAKRLDTRALAAIYDYFNRGIYTLPQDLPGHVYPIQPRAELAYGVFRLQIILWLLIADF